MCVAVLWLYLALVSSEGCPEDENKLWASCDCGKKAFNDNIGSHSYKHRMLYIVNCTNAGFSSAGMLTSLPLETEVLIWTGNDVEELEPNVFGYQPHEDLLYIDMSSNNIRTIAGKAYHGVGSVRELRLHYNNLYISQKKHPRVFSNFFTLETLHLEDAFGPEVGSKQYLVDLEVIFHESNLTNLKTLHLDRNRVKSPWNLNMMCQIPSLEEIYLDQNNIRDFVFNISCLPNLKYLDLRQNHIEYLNPVTLERFNEYAVLHKDREKLRIDFDKNPFNCDCNFMPMFGWLQSGNVSIQQIDKYTCRSGFPEENIGKKIVEVDAFICKQFVDDTKKMQPANVVLSILLTLMCLLIVVVVYLNRSAVLKTLQPAIHAVTRKVTYTSLQTEGEVSEVHM